MLRVRVKARVRVRFRVHNWAATVNMNTGPDLVVGPIDEPHPCAKWTRDE